MRSISEIKFFMCRMLGQITVEPETAEAVMLTCPLSLEKLSEQGLQPEPEVPGERGAHRDGCGLAWVEGKEIRTEKRSAADSWDDSYIQTIRTKQSRMFIAHNRQASKGLADRSERSSHPFTGKIGKEQVALCHNGGVRDFFAEAEKRSTSDSEIFLEHISQKLTGPTLGELRDFLTEFSANHECSSITSLLLTPESLFFWRHFNPKAPDWYRDYYTLYYRFSGNRCEVSSEPLDDEDWIPIKNGELCAVRLGNSTLSLDTVSFIAA